MPEVKKALPRQHGSLICSVIPPPSLGLSGILPCSQHHWQWGLGRLWRLEYHSGLSGTTKRFLSLSRHIQEQLLLTVIRATTDHHQPSPTEDGTEAGPV